MSAPADRAEVVIVVSQHPRPARRPAVTAVLAVLVGVVGLLLSGSVASAAAPDAAATAATAPPATGSTLSVVLWISSALLAAVIGMIASRRGVEPAQAAG